MSLAEYEDFVFRAGLLDRDDPVADWEALGARPTHRLADWLDGAGRSASSATAPTSRSASPGARGSPATATRTSLTARSSPARWRRRSRR